MPAVDDVVELEVELRVARRVGEVELFDFSLNLLELLDIGMGGVTNEPARHVGLQHGLYFADIAQELFVNRADMGAAIGHDYNETFAS